MHCVRRAGNIRLITEIEATGVELKIRNIHRVVHNINVIIKWLSTIQSCLALKGSNQIYFAFNHHMGYFCFN